MAYTGEYSPFDPSTGTVPDRPFRRLPLIEARARLIVCHRSPTELFRLAECIEGMVHTQREIDRKSPQVEDDSDLATLKRWVADYGPPDEAGVAGVKVQECFALLGLRKVAECLRALRALEADEESPRRDWVAAASAALEAAEAICWAEHLAETEDQRTRLERYQRETDEIGRYKAKAYTSLAARRNAKKRHAASAELKRKGLQWYAAHMHEYRSMDAAAEAMLGVVDVAFRTARAWIGEYRKNLRSARRP
jgi:hypothetical protein